MLPLKKPILAALLIGLSATCTGTTSLEKARETYVDGIRALSDGNTGTARHLLEMTLKESQVSTDATALSAAGLLGIYLKISDCAEADSLVSAPPAGMDTAGVDAKLAYYLEASLTRRLCGKKWDSSLIYAEKAIGISPTSQAAQINLMVARLERGRSLDKPSQLPRRHDLLGGALSLGLALLKQQLTTFDAGEVNNSIGRVYYAEANFPKARHYFESAVNVSPQNEVFHRNLAWTLYGGLSGKAHCKAKYGLLLEAKKNFVAAEDRSDASKIDLEIERLPKHCREK